ncbi:MULTISPECIES: OB-fold nucleic acid binding domain-containing protein [unclassified Psychrobacillus]|uniref:OB-fold nucleic acid binding domain-containing protein n=1 Tax=unclassified Psychrobacillus TaxID=2636677 RepID=UPI0030F58C1E
MNAVKKINESTDNELGVIQAYVTKKEEKENRKSEKYWFLQFTDSTGTLASFVWNNHPVYKDVEQLEEGMFVSIEGKISLGVEHQNIDIVKFRIEKLPEVGLEKDTLIKLKHQLNEHVQAITDDSLKQLVLNVLSRSDVNNLYFSSPATLMSGFSYTGGIIVSVVRLLRLIDSVSEVINEDGHGVSRDLLKTVAILEPVGKAFAYEIKNSRVSRTKTGEFFEELYLTMKVVLEELIKVDMPPEKKLLLEHCIGSAHGRSDWGDLHTARSKEAVMFGIIWNLNLQLGHFEHLSSKSSEGQEFAKLFQKKVYLKTFDN